MVDQKFISTVKALKGVIFDFDGVFTDNTVFVSEDGSESVRCWRGDGIGIQRLKSLGIQTCIISTETNSVVSARAEKLKIECIQGVENKLSVATEWIARKKLQVGEVAFLGNDVNDLECLTALGLPIIVADAHDSLKERGFYHTKAAGGFGAVREVCDIIGETLSE